MSDCRSIEWEFIMPTLFKQFTRVVLVAVFFLAMRQAPAQSLVSVTNLPANRFFGNGISGSYGLAATGPAADSGLWISSNWSSDPIDWNYHLYNVNTAGVPSDSIFPRVNYPGKYLIESFGLGYDGENFWYVKRRTIGGNGSCMIFKITPTGTILDSIPLAWGYVGGVCWADSGLWFCRYYPNDRAGLFKIDVNARAIVDSIPTYGTQPLGVAANDEYMFYVMDDNDGNDERIYAYDPVAGDTAYSIALPERTSGVSPKGMAWDGQFLWLLARPVSGNVYALYKYDLGGSGTPQLTLSGAGYDFSNTKIGQPRSHDVTITNTGTGDLFVSAVGHDNEAFYQTLVTPDTLAPAENVTFQVFFDPNTYGDEIDTLKIYSNDPNKPVARYALHGKGVYPTQEISLSATSHNFGAVLRDPPAEATNVWDLDVSNQGVLPLLLDSVYFSNPDFFLSGSVTYPIAIDSVSTARLRIGFNPSEVATYTDTMTLLCNDSSEALIMVMLQGTGFDSSYSYSQVFWTFMAPDNPGTSADDYSVEAIRAIPDVTGDGFDDVLIGTENYYVLCVSGNATGTTDTIWSFNTGLDNNNTGSLGTNGDDAQKALQVVTDLDDDGFHDVVAGYGGGNEGVYVLSGRTGEVIWSFNDPINYALGDINAVYAEEDFNGDAKPDVLATGSATDEGGTTGRRSVYCFDGVDGGTIWTYFTGAFTRGVVSIGDVNGNGKPDVVTTTGDQRNSVIGIDGLAGSPMWEFPVESGIYGAKELAPYPVPDSTSDVIVAGSTKYIYRLDGTTGAQRWKYTIGTSIFINQVILLDDVNGNGYADVIAPLTGSTAIMCIDGQTGTAIWNNALPMQTFGAARIPDISGDGINDAVYVSHDNRVYLVNGVTGTVIHSGFSFGTGGNNDAAESVNMMNDVDGNGSFEILAGSRNGMSAAISGGDILSAISSQRRAPEKLELSQNYPNPFNPTTTISFVLPQATAATLKIYNVMGQEVRTLFSGALSAGTHEVVWDGHNGAGRSLASGIYVYRLRTTHGTTARKMLLIK